MVIMIERRALYFASIALERQIEDQCEIISKIKEEIENQTENKEYQMFMEKELNKEKAILKELIAANEKIKHMGRRRIS